ncbi:Clavaminate synthase-like protein [Suillus paluster]|uniref:Clavaminate synthase-like protein n=1 Tax=Suillus paluster TaxID=48578 RepID=UPI001B87D15C|nr:Clavaminate synthase-like protein [Suillus paluster]KAG1754898.1 Clavaminate synthase-like protein [Suillus paluster]
MSTLSETLPVIDLDVFLSQPAQSVRVQEECNKAADALITYGALLVHDSRKDERPEIHYQVGVTLENTEKPKCAVDEPCLDIIANLDPTERPLDISGHHPDPKCRFFWKMGVPPPYETDYPALNAPNVVPQAPNIREKWESTMERWGHSMKNAVENIAEMTAIGLGLPRGFIKDAGKYGPHLLGPTASDLVKYGQNDTILAGFHSDLNCLTIHGRSRYPGLHIWARNTGKRIPVRFPPTGRYLLVQAGKQIEHLTGGLIKAGFHEVVVNETTLQTVERRKESHPDRPLIRISSTFFWHLSSDYDLVALPELSERANAFNSNQTAYQHTVYEPMKVGQQVQNELKHIALMA